MDDVKEVVLNENFAHLHVHTVNSLLDGTIKLDDMINTALERQEKSIAITDHGNMIGTLDFYNKARKKGIKPIVGCEVYVARGSRLSKGTGEKRATHLVLLCKNYTGFQNLCKIVSDASINGFYIKPRTDKEFIMEHSEGLICLSACIAGEIPTLITENNFEEARRLTKWYKDVFREDFYLEIQRHGNIPEQDRVNAGLISLANEFGIRLVATNDAHYLNKEDSVMHEVSLCMQTKTTLNNPKHFRFSDDSYYLKTKEEMLELFADIPQCVYETGEISKKCNLEIPTNEIHLPEFPVPEGYLNKEDLIEKLTFKGLSERYGENYSSDIRERAEYELSVIKKMNFVNYFLIVQDFINYAKSKEIPVGPGRGSGAGSIVAYALHITDIDPIKYELFFERFLNPERISMPDFDLDFCALRRCEVVDYVIKKYGEECVSQIITISCMSAKGAIRSVGRVLDIPLSFINNLAKLIPEKPGMTMAEAMTSDVLKKMYAEDDVAKQVIDLAFKIEGLPTNTSVHAAGIIIADKDISNYAPVMMDKGVRICQYNKDIIEPIGLIKMDFLVLAQLTIMRKTEQLVGNGFSINNIPYDDQKVYELMSLGIYRNIFQFDGDGIRNVLTQLKPKSIEDITAVISLYRPGPIDSIPEYVANSKDPEHVKYLHPKLIPILSTTYGVLVYQEQVMKIFQELAGFSLGRADIVRRAMSKKKVDVMNKESEYFREGLRDDKGNVIIEGAKSRGISDEVCNVLLDKMASFAAYAFNKSHAVCYAYIAYQTAYLMTYYPIEYLSATLTCAIDSSDNKNNKLAKTINECNKTYGIKILPPDINKCLSVFSPANKENKEINFALYALNGVGMEQATLISDERKKNGLYSDFDNFLKRNIKIKKSVVASLIKSGAFDCFNETRRGLFETFEQRMDLIKKDIFEDGSEQTNLYSLLNPEDNPLTVKNYEEWSSEQKVDYEYEATKLYLTQHPFSLYSRALSELPVSSITSIQDSFEANDGLYSDGQTVVIPALFFTITKKLSKKGTPFANAIIEDESSSAPCFVNQKKCNDPQLAVKNVVLASAQINVSESGIEYSINDFRSLPKNDDPDYESIMLSIKKKFKVQTIESHPVPKPLKTQSNGLYLRIPRSNGPGTLSNADLDILDKIGKIIVSYPGSNTVFLVDNKTNKVFSKSTYTTSVSACGMCLKELASVIGNDNVKFVL